MPPQGGLQRVEKCLLQPSLLMKRACGLGAASRDKACPRPAAPELKEAYRLLARVEKCLLQPSLLMKRAGGLCAASRDKACPRPAAPELKEAYRQFQVANYKCLCAAILIMRPEAKFYQFLFSRNVWEKLFDCEQQWKLPLKMTWSQQKTIHTVVDSPTSRTSATSASRTTRTRMFLRTLSENPLQFDLMDTDEEPPENSHEIELVDNELNSQECADTVMGLLQHASSLHHTGWVTALAEGLTGSAPLAQWHTLTLVTHPETDDTP
ncbi:uncharacterized protein LOC135085885 [Ostrinia nubilalis]|uniref:uncharacterized protein LOC135085885 n=1 Tax=Ostrinia nubilalis TaxID=29057 RepID=UPI0030823661